MQKVELLAPAGTMEALKAAVQYGCDAVYLGGTMFGARAFAGNFQREEMIEAISYAHLYDVKVYVTMNTLIYEDEMEQAYQYAKFLYEHGVDALIIQDLGLFDRLRTQLPDFELHVSTQMHVHNVEGIRFLKKKGAHRIVLPRETTIEQVREFAKEQIDLEVFVHGALCISYSGQCLMSEALFHRSGNRGECAQACRMKYELLKMKDGVCENIKTDGDYILSPRDLNTLKHIPEMIEAGIASFKIEGRMKRPEYVAQVVSAYRRAIDAYYAHMPFSCEEMQREMKLIFNRRFTDGHLFHEEGQQLMHAYRPNHMGIPIGKVVNAGHNRISIKLHEDIHQGDGIRILQDKEDQGFLLNKIYLNGLLVKQARKGETIELDCYSRIEPQSVVVKTSDILQLEHLRQYPKRTVNVTIEADFHIGKQMQLRLTDGSHHVVCKSDRIIEEAKTSFLEEARIRQQLSKCQDTPFMIQELKIHADEKCFLSIKELNQLRRETFEKLIRIRMRNSRQMIEKPYHKEGKESSAKLPSVMILVHTQEQYEACRKEGFQPLYTTSKELAKTYQMAFSAGSVCDKQDDSMLVCEIGALTKPNGYICEPSLYAANSYTCACLKEQGIKQILLPYEISLPRIQQLIKAYQKDHDSNLQFGMEVYGFRDMMIMKYCPIQTYEQTMKHCDRCRQYTYVLKDKNGQRFRLMGDTQCHMHVLSKEPYDLIADIDSYQKAGIRVFQLRFTIETKQETEQIIKKFKSFTES